MTDTASTRSPLRRILLIAGSVLVAGALVVAVVGVTRASTQEDRTGLYTVGEGFSSLDVDVSVANVVVRFGDVDEAELDFDSSGTTIGFTYRVDGGTLRVKVGDTDWWPFGGLGLFDLDDDPSLVVTLPDTLDPIDLDVNGSVGNLDVDGDFRAVKLSSSAGEIRLTGSATELVLDSSAGSIIGTDLDVSGTVDVDSSAGNTTLSFSSLPSGMTVDTSAGNVRVDMPDGEYEIQTDTAVGRIDQGLPSSPGAERVYRFDTSAGNVTLRLAD